LEDINLQGSMEFRAIKEFKKFAGNQEMEEMETKKKEIQNNSTNSRIYTFGVI
jgi:hypothetical protein